MDNLKTYPHFLNIEQSLKASTTIDILVNREKASLHGVNLDNIGSTIEYLIIGKRVGDFRMGNNIYDFILRYNIDNRNYVESVKNILVKSKDNMLPLQVVAKIDEKLAVKSYSHYNSSKLVTNSSDLAPSYKINDAIDLINKVANKFIDNNSTKLEYIGITFLFAFIFIYLVLSAQFESFTDRLLILVDVPFAIIGGVLALLLTRNSINMYSNIGLVTLIGLVTKNHIMIVEFANQLKNQGLKIKEAIVQSSSLRLRPILMTALATIFGTVPLIFAHRVGAASRNSIGLMVVGGMVVETLFTIFVIPVLYENFKKD